MPVELFLVKVVFMVIVMSIGMTACWHAVEQESHQLYDQTTPV